MTEARLQRECCCAGPFVVGAPPVDTPGVLCYTGRVNSNKRYKMTILLLATLVGVVGTLYIEALVNPNVDNVVVWFIDWAQNQDYI